MAWRIHEHVVRGEIDNRQRGCVHGRVWLAGIEQPLVLELSGDCHPDLAGCLLAFENPAPVAMTTKPPAFQQHGTAGDITAARKVRVFDIPLMEALDLIHAGGKPPEHMANSLYLEWYSNFNGRVVIESADYRLTVSEPEWRFTAEELAERERQADEGSDAFAIVVEADGKTSEWDEFRAEQFLRENDMTGEKYRRLLQQYRDHPDAERIIAREMGWSWLEEALEAQEQEEQEALPEEEEKEDLPEEAFADEEPDPAREGIDWVRGEDGRPVHPIYKRAKDAYYCLMDELNAAGQGPEIEDDALREVVDDFQFLTVKLAGALSGLAEGGHPPAPALIIAWLKRILEIHNRLLASLESFGERPFLPAARMAHYREELFAVREEILTLIATLRGSE